MEKEDTISVQWAQEDVETSYSLVNNNNNINNDNNRLAYLCNRNKIGNARTGVLISP